MNSPAASSGRSSTCGLQRNVKCQCLEDRTPVAFFPKCLLSFRRRHGPAAYRWSAPMLRIDGLGIVSLLTKAREPPLKQAVDQIGRMFDTRGMFLAAPGQAVTPIRPKCMPCRAPFPTFNQLSASHSTSPWHGKGDR